MATSIDVATAFERHARLVEAACRRVLGRGHPLLDDACQLVFVELARRPDVLADAHRLPVWLLAAGAGTARNLRRGELRRKRREAIAAGDGQYCQVIDSRTERIAEALAALSPRQGDAVRRYYLEGRPIAEVASVLGVTEGAAKKRVADGLARLRAIIGCGRAPGGRSRARTAVADQPPAAIAGSG